MENDLTAKIFVFNTKDKIWDACPVKEKVPETGMPICLEAGRNSRYVIYRVAYDSMRLERFGTNVLDLPLLHFITDIDGNDMLAKSFIFPDGYIGVDFRSLNNKNMRLIKKYPCNVNEETLANILCSGISKNIRFKNLSQIFPIKV